MTSRAVAGGRTALDVANGRVGGGDSALESCVPGSGSGESPSGKIAASNIPAKKAPPITRIFCIVVSSFHQFLTRPNGGAGFGGLGASMAGGVASLADWPPRGQRVVGGLFILQGAAATRAKPGLLTMLSPTVLTERHCGIP